DALIRSPYGQALLAKLALVAVLLAIAAVNLFALRPWLERTAGAARRATATACRQGEAARRGAGAAHRGTGPARPEAGGGPSAARAVEAGAPPAGRQPVAVVRRLVRAEAVAAVAVLLASGILAVLPPAERPAAATEPVTWRAEVGGEPVELALQPGQRGAVTLSARSLGRVGLARGLVRLDMPEHPMGLYQVTLSPPAGRGTGTLEARAVLPMPGLWRLSWTLALENGAQATVTTDFEAAGAPGNQRQGRLSLRAAYQSTAGAIQATVALLGLAEAAVLVVIGWRRLWPLPFGAGLIALALGAWLLGQVAWIDAYPTTYVPNPLPNRPEVIEQGRRVYVSHCAACHGPEGRGDGPASAGMLPPPADLTGVHVRQHTDGDLYWWISHGIEGTAMPAFADVLTEEERWAVIRFIRQLDRQDR
ncbi:MAG TPA: c-type cytochrome, partial [Thermaerobacter sp.]